MEKSIRFISYLVGFLVVAVLVQSITATKFSTLKAKSGLTSPDVVSIKVREQQLDCLAINIYREAGHDSFEGKVAVAQVTMNRVKDGRFGKDVCGVVYQKGVAGGVSTKCSQRRTVFSCYICKPPLVIRQDRSNWTTHFLQTTRERRKLCQTLILKV